MPRHGIDFSPVRLLAEKTPFTCRILPDSVIGIPALLARYDFCASVEGMNATVECEVQRDATLHGMGLWYTERLSSSVALSTAPGTVLPERLWPNHFFPCATQFVHAGDRVRVSIRAGFALASDWSWEVEVSPAGS